MCGASSSSWRWPAWRPVRSPAALLVLALRRRLVPADLEVAVAIMFVVAAYVAAETVRPEAGLFATTAMGVILANQRLVSVRNLRIFGDPIVSLLIGSLFIVLASRVEPGSMLDHLPATLVLVAFLVLVVRPLVVFLCTFRSKRLAPRERAFLACMAPRGIVAGVDRGLLLAAPGPDRPAQPHPRTGHLRGDHRARRDLWVGGEAVAPACSRWPGLAPTACC